MATGHIRPGNTMPYTNGGGTAITAGTPVLVGTLLGIALNDIAAGATGELALAEVWNLPKDATLAITQGDQLYWDDTNDEVDKTNTNVACGRAYTSALAAATHVQVLLNV